MVVVTQRNDPSRGAGAACLELPMEGAHVPVGCSLRSTPPSTVESKLPARESFQATWLPWVSAVQALGDARRRPRMTAKAFQSQLASLNVFAGCLTSGPNRLFAGMRCRDWSVRLSMVPPVAIAACNSK